MVDPRVSEYARLLVSRCIDARPGWQVVIRTDPPARPLVEELEHELALRGAYALVRLRFPGERWARAAPLELLSVPAGVDRYMYEHADAWIEILAPENTRDRSVLGEDRVTAGERARAEFRRRQTSLELRWVGCCFPTQAQAQDADMTLPEFEDFLYAACLLDWDAEAERMARYKERFDRAVEVRVVGSGTDIRFGLDGREGMVDDGKLNVPGGEFFFSPEEEATEGVIEFSEFPATHSDHVCDGVRLRFESGRVVDAAAQTGEDYLLSQLDADEGARVVGELGIGCNPSITRHMRHTLFDEKMDGTIHIALGAGFPFLGGRNESVLHWDMVKSLRDGGAIELDGAPVQQNARWLI